MRIYHTIAFIALLLFSVYATAQEHWVSDNEMNFKIKVPNSYKKSNIWDGTDKVHTFISPDENVFVRVRSMKATSEFTTDILQQVFEQNIIKGAQIIMNEDGDLHGIPARASAYTWAAGGDNAVLAIYYIIQNGFAYVIWAAAPQAEVQQYSAESDRIIDSFSLLQGNSQYANSITSNDLVLLQTNLGTSVNKQARVLDNSNIFQTSTQKINLGFSYSGNTYAAPIALKWFSRTHNMLLQEHNLNTPRENGGHGFGFISNQGNPWPEGSYSVEIWYDGKKLSVRDFQIQ